MSQKHVTTRVSEDLYEKIERIQQEEQTDRSTAVKRLLERGVGDWQIETAVRRYREGTISQVVRQNSQMFPFGASSTLLTSVASK
ncbi:hypothetical protein [Halorussus caseinilyticus]|uniref:Ribbon-helix-helix protein CopG domain-containing protein n=1 Tax=Halorussus caseinilyticus TaxID=3034025 RepID=A0ABD5WNT8_9EURY